MALPGLATPEGTNRYRDRLAGKVAPGHFRSRQGLSLSSVGIGTYLGNADDETDNRYVDCVVRAVELGANVIDTAANYRFQRSERSIGKALRLLTEERGIDRSEVLLCTKGGYLPFDGAPPRNVRAYIEETFVRPGIASFEDFVGGSHCMTPAYLENQIEQSLRNMGVDSVDVYYIHNPESQLGSVSQETFYERLREAFKYLESARADGKLAAYGVATWNGFRVSAQSNQYHSLSGMVELARELAGKEHGFKFIQLPFNLGMPEALTVRNHRVEGADVSVIEAAGAFDVNVLSSASILQGRVAYGLPESIRGPLGPLTTDAQRAIQFVRSTPGITTALVGMSHTEHVEENLQLAQIPPATTEDFLKLFENDAEE
jgi:aryl-alcohol dehydrogenase-like predicted oxidoreductase